MARFLITKLGLDGHDVGVKVLTVAARDAGHEVVYLGIRQTVETVVSAAVDEDVDLVAVSILSGAHGLLLPRLVEALRAVGCTAPVVVGGLIPDADQQELLDRGVAAVVPPGVTGSQAVAAMETLVGRSTNADAR